MPAGWARIGLAALVALVVLVSRADGESAPGGEGLTIGVVPQRPFDAAETKVMTEAGISSVRVWFSWAQVEGKRGEFDWGLLDETVAANADGGLTTLPFLFGTPAWAAGDDGQSCDGGDCISFAPRSEASRSAFAGFAAAAVRRYGPGGNFWSHNQELPERPIRIWQIWNEPNLVSFYHPAVDPIAYASLVQAAAAGIRSEDPDATVLLAGLTGTRTNTRRMSTTAFLTELYSVADVAASFDGIAVHPYNRKVRGTLDQIKAARAVAAAHGDDAGLWVTELGWASAGKRRWGLVKSPDGQARMLRLTFARLLDHAAQWDVRAAYWYAWRDTERGQSVCGWCPWSGLIDRAGRKKPAYWELRALARG
ncbi:MAG: beta-galactosidase [Vicinamibacteria bacterium]